MGAIWRAFRALMRRARFERDLRDELRTHLEHRADDLTAAGLSRDEALRRAKLEFGALEAYKEQCRDEGGFSRMRPVHGLIGDVKLAVRRLVATPLFTLFSVSSLAIGIGVTAASYSVVAAVFFKSFQVAGEGRVAYVMTPWEGRLMNGGFSVPDYDDLRRAQRSFESMTASANFFPAIASPLTTDLMRAEAVDGSYFPLLGVGAALGRVIGHHDVQSASPVVVLSHALWRLRFREDPTVVGQVVRLAGRPFEVIGIAPKGFEGLGKRFDGTRAWIPLSADPRLAVPAGAGFDARDATRLIVVGRLAPGVTIEQASAELTAIGGRLDGLYPRSAARQARGPSARAWVARLVVDEREEDVIMRRFGWTLVALVALVLVVACTNIANLVLARGSTRSAELSVRRALGASRWRLVREQCVESGMLAAVGGGAAWAVFAVLAGVMNVDLPIGSRMLVSFAPSLDPAVVVFAVVTMLLSLIVFGLEPALHLTRDSALKNDLASSTGAVIPSKSRRQRRLVRWQVAISTGFFVIASMCVKYTMEELRHDSGVDLDRAAAATMNFWAQQWDQERARRTLNRVLEEVATDHRVESAAVSTGVPFGASSTRMVAVAATDRQLSDPDGTRRAIAIDATPALFKTLGIPLVRGRGFNDLDDAGSNPVAVLSERTARSLFGTADAVGRQLSIQDQAPVHVPRSVAGKLALTTVPPDPAAKARTVTVVGVAANTDVVHLFRTEGDVVYLPLAQVTERIPFGIALVRTSGNPYEALQALREAIRRADPDVAVESAGTAAGLLGGPAVFLRAASLFALGLGGLTLGLAMIGLYGVQSHGVALRTREIGIRMSFGATAAQIRSMVLKDGYRPVLQGIALGLLIGLTGRGLVRAFLWEKVTVLDAWMLLAVPVPLVLAAFFACFMPARRASRVDPLTALRHL